VVRGEARVDSDRYLVEFESRMSLLDFEVIVGTRRCLGKPFV
jgi:hypothetical protein